MAFFEKLRRFYYLCIVIIFFFFFQDALDSGDLLDGKREYPLEMELDRTAMLLLLSVNYLRVAERLTVTVNKARNLLLVDRKGKLGESPARNGVFFMNILIAFSMKIPRPLFMLLFYFG